MAETVYEIEVDYPEANDHTLRLSLGACKFRVEPGAAGWVQGEYLFPEMPDAPIRIKQKGGTVHIYQDIARQPRSLKMFAFKRTPQLFLQLGDAKPFHLSVEAGAYEGRYELGGLPLTGLDIQQGAGKVTFDFSQPNPVEMGTIDVDAGAMSMRMDNLANANFSELLLEGGASKYHLNFAGTLLRDAHVKITAGVASVTLEIPVGTAAQISARTNFGKFSADEHFTRQGNTYFSPAAVNGKTPMLTVEAEVSMGTLNVVGI